MDITVPVYHFAETHYLADAVVTLAYKRTMVAGIIDGIGCGPIIEPSFPRAARIDQPVTPRSSLTE